MVSSRFRTAADPYISYLVKPLVKSRLNPSFITLGGFVFSMIAGLMYSQGNLIFASAALIISSVLDIADGAVARLTNRVSAFGGFLDSLSDRYSDSIILIGIALYFQDHYLLILVVLMGNLLVSYTRSRAEMEIEKCDVGFGERAERLIIIIGATLLEAAAPSMQFLYWALIFLAFITHLTVAQRVLFTFKQLG